MFTKHSISVGERAADVSMEEEFWDALRDIAADRNTRLSVLLKEVAATVDGDVDGQRLASTFRVYILEHYLRLPTKQRPNRRAAVRSAVRIQLH
jgi:predicted DNA-binding ribbon-helix-helix protein